MVYKALELSWAEGAFTHLEDIKRRIAIPLSNSFRFNKDHLEYKNSLDSALE
jgi:hypothetical protein